MSTPRSWETKVDHRLLARLEAAKEDPVEGARLMTVFVSFQGDLSRLRALGLRLRSVSGSVAVATMALADVPAVAQASEILFIELARAVRPGGSQSQGQESGHA